MGLLRFTAWVGFEKVASYFEKNANVHFAEGDPAFESIVEKLHGLIDLLNNHISEVVPRTNSLNQPDVNDIQGASDVSNQGLNTVPKHIFSEVNRSELDLSYNQLTGSLPAEIRHLSKLQTLNLSHNQFTGVPAEIGQLTELRTLNLSHNQITGLPHELGNLSKLQTLDLRGNDYSTHDLNIITQRLPETTDILID